MMLASLLYLGAPHLASAGTCEDRCESSFKKCASAKAAGCEVGGALAGAAAKELGKQIPIPGMGALFGAVTKSVSEEQCKKLLVPCEEIRANCLSSCVAKPGQAGSSAKFDQKTQTIVIQQTAPPEKKVGTLRVFADQPRMVVYLNDQRMGATPKDELQPFVTPEIPAGKYWVVLTSLDKRWKWEGEKDVEEGNVNAVEATMIDLVAQEKERVRALKRRKKDVWKSIRDADNDDDIIATVYRYTHFIETYPDDKRKCKQARARIETLRISLESELYRHAKEESNELRRYALCDEYLREFADGPHAEEVRRIKADVTEAFEAHQAKLREQEITRMRAPQILDAFRGMKRQLDGCRSAFKHELSDARGIVFYFRGSDGAIMGASISGWDDKKASTSLGICLKNAVRGKAVDPFDIEKITAEYRFTKKK